MALNEYDDMMMEEKSQELSASPAAPVNKYDAMVEEENSLKKSNVAQSMIYAAEKEPTRIIKAIQMAKDLGTDVDFVDRNMEKIEKSKKTVGVDYDALLRDSPGVAKFMETPENAAVGQDDMDGMARVDKALRFIPKKNEESKMKKFGSDMYQAGEGGWNNMTANVAAVVLSEGLGDRDWIEAQAMMNKRAKVLSDKRPDYVKEFQRVMQEESEDVAKGIDKLKMGYKQWTNGEKLKAMRSFVEGDVQTVAELFDIMREAVWGPERMKGLLYSAAESLSASTPALVLGGAGAYTGPAAIVAVPAGVFVGTAAIETGATINALLEAKGVDTTDPDALENAYKDTQMMADIRSQARKKGLTTGAVESLVSIFGGQMLGKLGKVKAPTITQKVVARAADTGVEMLGESVGQIGGELAQYDGDFSKVNIPGAIQEGVMSLGSSFIQAGQSGAIKAEMAGRRALYNKDPMEAASEIMEQTDRAQQAVGSAQNLQEMAQSLRETKNLKNIPEKVSELVEAATGGQGSSAVYFQTDDFDSYWSKKGVNPVEKAAEIMGDNGKAYMDAKNTGGSFEVPLEKYASTVGLTEDFEGLLPVTRTSPDAMTLTEAQEHLKTLPGMVQQIATEATKAQDLVEPVEQAIQTRTAVLKQDIQDRLVAAGRPIREAKFAAQQVESFFKTTAQRYGMSMEQFEQFVTKYNPTINQMTQGSQTFSQNPDSDSEDSVTYNQLATTTQESGPQVSPLGFFSQVEAEVQKMDFKTMPGKDLSGRIKNIAGIKKEELEFLGLNEWLDTQEGKVSKEDVVNFIRNQGLVVDQIVLGDEFVDEDGNVSGEGEGTWGEEERDHSNDYDDIQNQIDNDTSDRGVMKEFREESRERLVSKFTDEEGNIDKEGLEEAIEEDVTERIEKNAEEYVKSDDYYGARFDVTLTWEAEGERTQYFTLNGSSEYGWYSDDLGKDLGSNLSEAKIQLLAGLRDKGKIDFDSLSLSKFEDLKFKTPTGHLPTEKAPFTRKVNALIKNEYDKVLAHAKEEFNWYFTDNQSGMTSKEIKKEIEEAVKKAAEDLVTKQYADPNNKKNTVQVNIEHPIIKADIRGNNIYGWTLAIYGRKDSRVKEGYKTKLEGKTLEEAQKEATQIFIDKRMMSPPKAEADQAAADEQGVPLDPNRLQGKPNFRSHIKSGESENYREFLLTLPKSEDTFVYSGHFRQENIVAHARVTDRVDVNGKKVLFVEEVQSDWHQKGRDRGYKTAESTKEKELLESRISEINGERGERLRTIRETQNAVEAELKNKIKPKTFEDLKQKKEVETEYGNIEVFSENEDSYLDIGVRTDEWIKARKDDGRKIDLSKYVFRRGGYDVVAFDTKEEVLEYYNEQALESINDKDIEAALAEDDSERSQIYFSAKSEQNSLAIEQSRLEDSLSEQRDILPDAPLKNTEAWAGLVMKRMIRLAVEQGYDSVAWSPAAFQIERWGSEEVSWVKKPGLKPSITERTKEDGGGFQVVGEGVPQKGSVFATKEEAQKHADSLAEEHWLVGSTEQVGGRYEGGTIEEMARARGDLLERSGERVTSKEDLRGLINSTLSRERTQKQLDALTDNFWEQMQTKPEGLKAPRREGMTNFYDKMIPKVVSALLKKLDKDAKVTTTKIRTASSGALAPTKYEGPTLSMDEVDVIYKKAFKDNELPSKMMREIKGVKYRVNERGENFVSVISEMSPATVDYFGGTLVEDAEAANSEIWNIELTPTIKAKTMEGFALFQGDPNTPLGQITFGETGINIDLLSGANPSTFMHEMGHAYLQIMTDLQAGENVPQNVKDDFAKILEFLEIESSDQIGVEQHEKFARGFEAYLREGRAPSEGLRKAFANFKVWLLTVYKNLKELRVELTPEIRGVFDRMLATEEEIAQAQNKISGEFDMQKLDVPTEKQMEHMIALSEWKTRAEEALMSKIMGDYERQKQAEYREKRKEVQAQVEMEANELTVYKAISLLRDGTRPDGSALPDGTTVFKIERSSIEKAFSKEIVAGLPARIVAPVKKGGGLDVEMAASMLGFEDADQMIQMLVNTPKREDYIKMRTDKEMKTLYPEVYAEDHETLKEEAMAYVHDELGSKVKRMQLEMIAAKAMPVLKEGIRQVARRLPSNRQIRVQAEKVIGSMKSKDIRPVVFLRAERKAAKEAGVLLARGDFEGAYKSKERELYNFELYRAAISWNDQYKGALNNFKKIYKSDEKVAKTRDMDLVNAARAILSTYGVGKKDKTPDDYLDKMRSYDPDTYETISQLVEGSLVQASSFEEMTADDFIAVRDAIFAIWDLSKTSMEHIVEGQSLNREEVIAGLNNRIGEVTPSQERIGYDQKATAWQETVVKFLGVKSALRRVESWTEAMGGPFKKMLWTPISDAVNKYRDERKVYLKKFRDLTLEYNKTQDGLFDKKPIDAVELKRMDPDGIQRNYKFTYKGELIGALLHTGNESNLKKLLAGRKWGTINDDGTINSTAWDTFIKRMHDEGVLTKADWDYVQSLWDLMEELKPNAQKAHKQMYGYYFNEVTANSVSTPFGSYRGGYAPAVADNFISEDGRIKTEKEALEKMNNTFMFPTTGRGFTKKRVENYVTPLSIDLRLVGGHIDKVMRFTHIEPAVKSVSRIVMNKDFRHSLTAYDQTVGSELLVPWLQRAAQQRVTTPSSSRAADAFFGKIRANAGMNAMFLNVTNGLQQFTGWSISLLKVKPRHLRNALWTYTKSPNASAKLVSEKSSFMNARLDKEMSDIMRNLEELLTEENAYDKGKKVIQKHAYIVQSAFQNIVDVTTWIGAYEQAVEAGFPEPQAVKEADSAVRLTQGSLNAEDVSRFETGTPFIRVFTMFSSYFNNLANTLTTEAYSKNIREVGLRKGFGKGLHVYFFGFAIPAVMSEVIVRAMAGGDLDEDDDDMVLDDMMGLFFSSQFRTATAMIPVVGTSAALVYNQFDDAAYNDRLSTSPAISTLESALVGNAKNAYTAVFTDQSVNKKKATKDFLSGLSMLTGVPMGQIGKTTGYMIDVSEGKADPENPVEAVRGAVTGRTPR